ncbi:uncharacterized protein [Bemisia tabaci]|uniref:uncharacterized protein isoform X3 n=1 Tax=Bemisia tabaci TaxID=7038 RepID=UPI003B27DE58
MCALRGHGCVTHGFLLQQPESDSYAFRIDRGPTSDLNKTYNLKLQKEVKSLSAFCFGRRSDAFCTYQCRKVAQISTKRICEDSWFLSEAYEELEPCDHFGAGSCRWFRCHCLPLSEPNATEVTEAMEVAEVTLGFCKKTLLSAQPIGRHFLFPFCHWSFSILPC